MMKNICPNKIAILVLAHKNREQLTKLIREFDDLRFDVFVHIDAKSHMRMDVPIMKNSFCYILKRKECVPTYLNDFSLVDASINLIKAAQKKDRYAYYVLLTGQDYPIKSNDIIYETLMNSYPTCWIDSYGLDDAYKHGMMWVENVGHKRFSQRARRLAQKIVGAKFYYSHYGKIVKIPIIALDVLSNMFMPSPRKLVIKNEFTYSAGSHFWMLPDLAVNHIISVYDNNEKLSYVFKHSSAPEETYFQTALSTMPKAKIPDPYVQLDSIEKEMDNPALRLIKWYENGKKTSGHPATWTISDFDVIMKAKALFARKFEENSDIIKIIDSKLR